MREGRKRESRDSKEWNHKKGKNKERELCLKKKNKNKTHNKIRKERKHSTPRIAMERKMLP